MTIPAYVTLTVRQRHLETQQTNVSNILRAYVFHVTKAENNYEVRAFGSNVAMGLTLA